jgi:hypothetical protein
MDDGSQKQEKNKGTWERDGIEKKGDTVVRRSTCGGSKEW